MNVTYTHKGWFGICPIYLGVIDGECVTLSLPKKEK